MKVPTPRQLPSDHYFIQLRLGGQSVSVTAGSKAECIRQAECIKAEYRAGKMPKPKQPQKTLGAWIDTYIESKTNVLSPSTIAAYKSVRTHRLQSLMSKPVSNIHDWQAQINAEATQCSAKTLKNVWGLVSAALKFGGMEPPPVTLPQRVKADRAWLDPKQIKTFVAALQGQSCEIPALLGLSSLRRSEIMALTWDDIDLDNNTISIEGAAVFDEHHKLVRKDTNKNASSRRTIPIMMPELKAALQVVENKSGQVVTCNPNTIWKQVNRICDAHKLPKVGVHGLRHSFASLGYHLGMSELEVMQIGGWSDYQTMRNIYTHLAQIDRNKAENIMTQFYKNANETVNGGKNAEKST